MWHIIIQSVYLSFFGNWNPLSVHTILGVGDPLALHLSDTGGPGWSVWSMNRYVSIGDASEIQRKKCLDYLS